jgi:hypothetical protein
MVHPEAIEEVFILAGEKVGLCDYRPRWGGKFGTYTAKLINVTERREIMATATFRLQNISPLLMHNAAGMKPPDPDGQKMKVKKIPGPAEEAEGGAYRLPNGQLFLPADAAHASLIEGGRGRKIGKSSAVGLLGSSVFMTHVECPLVDPDTDKPITEYVIDSRRVIVVNAGVVRSRPRIDKWATEVTFEYDSEMMHPDVISEAFILAGRQVGLLEYRPRPKKGKPGPFGRYTAKLVKVTE